ESIAGERPRFIHSLSRALSFLNQRIDKASTVSTLASRGELLKLRNRVFWPAARRRRAALLDSVKLPGSVFKIPVGLHEAGRRRFHVLIERPPYISQDARPVILPAIDGLLL